MIPQRLVVGGTLVMSLLAVLAIATTIRSMNDSKRPAASAASALLFAVALLLLLWALGNSVS
jgi:uncharacterized membrane protein